MSNVETPIDTKQVLQIFSEVTRVLNQTSHMGHTDANEKTCLTLYKLCECVKDQRERTLLLHSFLIARMEAFVKKVEHDEHDDIEYVT
jgi:hypothetical protein